MSTIFSMSKIFGIFPFVNDKLSVKLVIVSAGYQLFYFYVFRNVLTSLTSEPKLYDYANILRRVVIVTPPLVHLVRLIFVRKFVTSLKPFTSKRGPFWCDVAIPMTSLAWKVVYYVTFGLRVRFRYPLIIVYFVITLMVFQYVLCIEIKIREIAKLENKIGLYPLAACNKLHRISDEVENIHKMYSPQLMLAVFAFLWNFVTNLFLLKSSFNIDINVGSVIENLCIMIGLFQRCTKFDDQVDAFYSKLFRVVWENNLCSNKKLVLCLITERRVKFSACGFFILGCPLLTSIIAAATSYLVILLQFE